MVEYTQSALREMASEEARRAGVDPELFIRLIQQESRFKPQATSRVGAKGLGQVMPDTARQPGYGVRPLASENLMDPQENLRFSADYFSAMLREFDGDVPKALAAYNAGAGAVQEYGGVPPFKETQEYVDIIAGGYNGSGGSASEELLNGGSAGDILSGGPRVGAPLSGGAGGPLTESEAQKYVSEDFLPSKDEDSFLDKLGKAAEGMDVAKLFDQPKRQRVRSLDMTYNRPRPNSGSRALQRMGIASLA